MSRTRPQRYVTPQFRSAAGAGYRSGGQQFRGRSSERTRRRRLPGERRTRSTLAAGRSHTAGAAVHSSHSVRGNRRIVLGTELGQRRGTQDRVPERIRPRRWAVGRIAEEVERTLALERRTPGREGRDSGDAGSARRRTPGAEDGLGRARIARGLGARESAT